MSEPAIALPVPNPPASTPIALQILPKGKAAKFTSENAREMARRSAIARAEKKAQREKEVAEAAPLPLACDDFVKSQLASVRAQIQRLNAKLLKMHDSQKLNWLASAVSKLAEQERILSGRPLPGQLKPKAPKRDSALPVAPVD